MAAAFLELENSLADGMDTGGGVNFPGLLGVAANGFGGFAILEAMEHLQKLAVRQFTNPGLLFAFHARQFSQLVNQLLTHFPLPWTFLKFNLSFCAT